MKIYLDMDGVLADFNGRFEQLFGERPVEQYAKAKHFYNHWDEFVETEQFRTLEVLTGAVELMNLCDSLEVPVEILSSTSNEKYHEKVAPQKLEWLEKNGITYKPNFVPGGTKKANHAEPWSILIDDSRHVVDTYRAAGGTAILHENFEKTKEQLLKLHLEWRGGE